MAKKMKEKQGADLLKNHFLAPRNAGRMRNATHRSRVRNPSCDDVLEIALRLERGVVQESRFLAQACSATIGIASLATEKSRGLTTAEIFSWSPSTLESWVGHLPKAKLHALELVCRAFRDALQGSK